MYQFLGWMILLILVISVILLVLDINSDKQNDGTLLNIYLENGKKNKKNSNSKIYIIAAIVCLLLTITYLFL